MQEEIPPKHFEVGDLVLVVNADYNPDLIGHAGTIARQADHIAGYDKYGRLRTGLYVVVDLPDKINRHGTTLWYKKPQYLVKISPDNGVAAGTRNGKLPVQLPAPTDVQAAG